MRTCNKCSDTLELGVNISVSRINNGDYICKPCNTNRGRKYRDHTKDNHYSVYLLPDHNYVGVTGRLKWRMYNHKWEHNRNTSNVKVLHTFSNLEEALIKEKEYHNRGYEG